MATIVTESSVADDGYGLRASVRKSVGSSSKKRRKKGRSSIIYEKGAKTQGG